MEIINWSSQATAVNFEIFWSPSACSKSSSDIWQDCRWYQSRWISLKDNIILRVIMSKTKMTTRGLYEIHANMHIDRNLTNSGDNRSRTKTSILKRHYVVKRDTMFGHTKKEASFRSVSFRHDIQSFISRMSKKKMNRKKSRSYTIKSHADQHDVLLIRIGKVGQNHIRTMIDLILERIVVKCD